MPFVRCKFYSESGEPVRGGCHRKGAGCAFIHPEDSDWIKAPPPSFKSRDQSGDPGGSKSWGRKRTAIPSAWDAGGKASTGTTDTGGGLDAGSGWGDGSEWGTVSGWGTGSGWGSGSGWDAGGSTSTLNQASESARSNNPFATTSCDTSTSTSGWNQVSTAAGNMKSSEHGWGGGTDKATESGWGAGWGNDKDTDKNAESAWGSTWNGGWGGSGEDNKERPNSWGVSDPMVVDKRTDKGIEQNREKRKAVPVPPRIRIPDNEHKKPKISGTNEELLGSSKRGEPRSFNPVVASTPVTTLTPVATLTPTDSSRLKRKRDVALDDKLGVFKEYVKAWERGVRARFLLTEAEAKRDRWFRTQKSTCYARIGEAGRKKLDGERAECDKEVNSQREKLSSAITSLVGLHDTIASNLDLGQRYNIGEQAQKFIAESKTFVDEVRTFLVEHILKGESNVRPDNTQKCRSGVNVDATSIESLRSQVRDLEERFDQAQTELTLRHQRDIRSEIDVSFTAKVAALRVAHQYEIGLVTSQQHAETIIQPSVLESMERTAEQVRELDAKIPEIVEDIRVLLLRVDATTKRVSELEEELSMNKASYSKVEEMAAEKEETVRRMDERLKKIREQFDQLDASQPPGPARQPSASLMGCDSQDMLMESLRPAFEAVLDKFYEQEVRPSIESLQRAVIQASDRHQEDAIRVLWGKIQPAMNMVAGVSRWLDSQELRLTAPVEVDHTYPTSRTNFHS